MKRLMIIFAVLLTLLPMDLAAQHRRHNRKIIKTGPGTLTLHRHPRRFITSTEYQSRRHRRHRRH